MKLPTKKTTPSDDPMKYSMLLYGQEKCGKSTFASNAPGAIFLATEPGLNALSVYQVNIESWQDLLDACKKLATEKHDFKTIIIDTADNAYEFCAAYVSEKELDGKDPSDFEYGRGWRKVTKEFRRVINKLGHLDYGLILISHSKVETVKSRTGSYDVIMPTLPGGCRKYLIGVMDSTLLAEVTFETGEDGSSVYRRIMHTTASPKHIAGSRIKGLPAEIPLDYNEYIKAFKTATKGETK
jgi:hypothetical protein